MSKQGPNEKLLHALGDIGGDLIDRAEHAAFRGSRWRQWGALAACLAVVVCAGLISIPMLFGGKSEAPSSEQAVSAPTAAADEKSQMKEETVMEEAPAETEPVTEESAAEAPEEGFGTTDSDTGKTYAVTHRERIIFRHTYYYLTANYAPDADTPASELGSVIGTVEDAENESLIGCTVVQPPYVTMFTNHAVDGLAVPQQILVQTADGWLIGSTNNEKTVSRYTIEDVQDAMDRVDSQWILDTFALPMERLEKKLPDFTDVSALTAPQLEQLFRATIYMNTGTAVSDVWMTADNRLLVPQEDFRWRLDRFLDGYTYDPADSADLVNDGEALLLDMQSYYDTLQEQLYLQLLEVEIQENVLTLYLCRYEDEAMTKPMSQRVYTIRFDEDSWRYLSIVTVSQ